MKLSCCNWALPVALLGLASCAAPRAAFQVEKEEVLRAPATVHFSAETAGVDSVLWNFGDGSYSKEAEVDHIFWMSGRYPVTLTVWKGRRRAVKKTELIVQAPERCLVRIHTPMGDMVAELSDLTPGHRDNFTKLVEAGFYDSLLFHRVIEGFMIQGGDPRSRSAGMGTALGSGGPGYQIPAEFTDSLIHIKGALAAARIGDQANPEKKSSGSQFYIVQGNKIPEDAISGYERQKGIHYTAEQKRMYAELGGTPLLDREYTVFGRVIQGLEVIDKIATSPTGRADRPLNDVYMVIKMIK